MGTFTLSGGGTNYDGVIRDVGLVIGTLHSAAQMDANIAALMAEYSITA